MNQLIIFDEAMANSELIYNIEEIFLNAEPFKSKFRIPDYQRGYKWTPDNVTKLMDDINCFKSAEEGAFYCVQNITINKTNVDGEEYYNVVDGQQRLTTLYLILCYIETNDAIKKFKEKLIYEIRKSTAAFLKEDICTKQCWQQGYQHSPKHMDEYYILEAAKAINTWFKPNEKGMTIPDKGIFRDKLLHKTKLIVNLLEGGDEEKTFANLNGVKVSLDGSDLVRAMLITRSLGSYKTSRDNVGLTKQYRIRMGMEIDEISLWWSNPEVKKFFGRMIPDSMSKNSKNPKFDQSSYPIDQLYFLYYLAKTGSPNGFSLDALANTFCEDTDTAGKNNSFNRILSFHYELQDWFENSEIYHYLGYLFANCKETSSGDGNNLFSKIYGYWINVGSKKAFVEKIIGLIKESLLALYEKEVENTGKTAREMLLESIKFNTTYDWYHSNKLPYFLIMVDVLDCLRSSNMGRLPVDFFKVNEEDREHIGCQTPNDKQLSNKTIWLEFIEGLEGIIGEDNSQINKLKDLISSAESIDEGIKDSIIASLTQFGLNSIGNLALLNKSVNRGYGNDPYNQKAKAILNNHFNIVDSNSKLSSKGKYIRPHTLKVFVQDKKEQWGPVEIEKCASEIYKIIDEFFGK